MGRHRVVGGVKVDFTAQEETARDAEEAAWAEHLRLNAYITLRRAAYASTGDQLDMQYHDLVDGTTTWKDHIAAVKAAHPKPE